MAHSRLLEGLVSADSLAAVEITIDAGVKLVHQVRLVRTGRVGCGSWTGAVEAVVVHTGRGAADAADAGMSSLGLAAMSIMVVASKGRGASGSRGASDAMGLVSTMSIMVVAGKGRGARGARGAMGLVSTSNAAGVVNAVSVSSCVVCVARHWARRCGSALGVHTHIAASVHVRIDARIDLIHQVRVMGTRSVVGSACTATNRCLVCSTVVRATESSAMGISMGISMSSSMSSSMGCTRHGARSSS